MTPPYVSWSHDRGFYYDPEGAYVRRQDYDFLLQRVTELEAQLEDSKAKQLRTGLPHWHA